MTSTPPASPCSTPKCAFCSYEPESCQCMQFTEEDEKYLIGDLLRQDWSDFIDVSGTGPLSMSNFPSPELTLDDIDFPPPSPSSTAPLSPTLGNLPNVYPEEIKQPKKRKSADGKATVFVFGESWEPTLVAMNKRGSNLYPFCLHCKKFTPKHHNHARKNRAKKPKPIAKSQRKNKK